MAKQQRIDPRIIERNRAKAAAARSTGKPVSNTAPAKASPPKAAPPKAANAKGKTVAPSKPRGKSGRPGGRPLVETRPATLGTWLAGARIPTLLLAIAPVALGTGIASEFTDHWYDHWVRALLALAVALAMQIGVNYANDYSDGVRGTDKDRVGPQRLVGSGRAKPRTVLTVALVFFALAAIAGAALIVLSQQWWLFAGGVVALAAAWFYTGGKRPYGYYALGEVVAFLFFGVAAVAGTMFTQVGTVNADGWFGGAALGAFAAAVLLVNNLRDRERDRTHGKRTLAVLLGRVGSRVLYVVLMVAPFAILVPFVLLYDNAFYVYFAAVAAIPAIIIVIWGKTPPEFMLALRLTLITAFAFGVGLALAIAF
ncbi:MAG: 1,4-dihydroxy-2-naphthoate polyprenyltransferase [Kofleriaceae bacterium]